MIVFVHIPKTGGTTFQTILARNFGIHHCNAENIRKPDFNSADLAFTRRLFPGLRSISGSNLVDPLALAFPDPFFVTFLRNPVARVFSHYQNMLLSGHQLPFEETLRSDSSLQNLHVKIMAGGLDLDKAKRFLERCDFVGLIEKFDLSLRVLDKLCPVPLNMQYRRGQVAPDNTVRKKLESDPRIVELVREYNKLDLELYDFGTNEIFPRMCKKAGFNSADKVESFENQALKEGFDSALGGFYNRMFRQLSKLRF